jgi:NADAR domain
MFKQLLEDSTPQIWKRSMLTPISVEQDRIWGVGFGAKNAEKRRLDWGLNLLGKALVSARQKLRAEQEGMN